MTRDKWLDLKDKIKTNFKIEEEYSRSLENVPTAVVEGLIFTSPLGKIKIEWVSKPKTLGEKTAYSNRIGSQVKVEKVYAVDERSEFIKAYRLVDEDWDEISGANFYSL